MWQIKVNILCLALQALAKITKLIHAQWLLTFKLLKLTKKHGHIKMFENKLFPRPGIQLQ